ncbi:MAG: xanthine dehydrogenase family protein subunit M [Nitrososphaerota archaeon]|nr:xanthine dehydrogenase family protein subunit M [Nitrososphaerota archaeon]
MSTSEVPKFGYLQATSVDNAVSLLTQYADKARIIGGATDILTQMKNGIQALTPQYLIDISALNLNYVKFSQSDGLRIGATTTISTVARDSNVISNYAALAQAAGYVASPQIQNQATIAGDVLQEVWCWYLRNNYPSCWRNEGNLCYAAEGGDNRYYHSIFGGNLCYAIHAGDIAPALFALGAEANIVGPSGQRTVTMDELMPGISVVDGRVKENSLAYNEILTEFHIPTPESGTKSAFYKVRNRGTFDFALASAAVSATFNGSTISSVQLVLGAVANKPLRATSAEQYLDGKTLSESIISSAADTALSGATPLTGGTGNSFRVFLAKGAVKNALRSISS